MNVADKCTDRLGRCGANSREVGQEGVCRPTEEDVRVGPGEEGEPK